MDKFFGIIVIKGKFEAGHDVFFMIPEMQTT